MAFGRGARAPQEDLRHAPSRQSVVSSAPGVEDARPRFLCDEMLAQLGRWLRAAGYDAMIAQNRASDRALVVRAIADTRVLLTRDRKLCEIREARGRALWLPGDRIGTWAAEVTSRLHIDWLAAPFSRCLLCNVVLRRAPQTATRRLPASILAAGAEVDHCPQCDRLYWEGGHVRRMRLRLARWRAGDFA